MDTSNIINLVLLIITAIGVGVAVWQAAVARSARNDARTAAAESAVSAEASSQIQERIAQAAERQAAIAEAAATPKKSWRLETNDSPHLDQQWRVINQSGYTLTDVIINVPSGIDDRWIIAPDFQDVSPDESITFTFIRRNDSPTSATIYVDWLRPDQSGRDREVFDVR